MIIGSIIYGANKRGWLELATQFDSTIFILFLLPPIIFRAGLGMRKVKVYRNFLSVLLFSFVGTIIATFVFGGMMYGLGRTVSGYGHQGRRERERERESTSQHAFASPHPLSCHVDSFLFHQTSYGFLGSPHFWCSHFSNRSDCHSLHFSRSQEKFLIFRRSFLRSL